MLSWYLVYCKSKQETRAEENLVRQGFSVFRPTINVIKQRVGRKNIVREEPLFPRYVFLHVNPKITSIAPVLSTYGVSNFVMFGDKYATAPTSLIDEIREKTSRSTEKTHQSEFKPGDSIYVDGHGFDQVKAIYCNPCGTARAMILMRILGKESRLRVPVECITSAVEDTKAI